jgi:hypothetical protein
MPLPQSELAQIDLLHRRRRLALQGRAGLIVSTLFRRLTVADITTRNSPNVEAWLRDSSLAVQTMKARAAAEAQSYYDVVRDAQAPTAPKRTFEILSDEDVAKIRSSLFVTGVVGARQRLDKIPGEPDVRQATTTIDRIQESGGDVRELQTYLDRQLDVLRSGRATRVDDALTTSSQAAGASAVRHVGDGARQQIIQTSKADPRAVGYIRTLGADPCYFCAALASRGPVYEGDSFDESDARFEGPGTAKVHDSCTCGLRAVFTRGSAEVPELNALFMDMWVEGMSMLEWRQMFEARAA